jgi:hypothetical protein
MERLSAAPNLVTAQQLHRIRNFFLDELTALSLNPTDMSYRDSARQPRGQTSPIRSI